MSELTYFSLEPILPECDCFHVLVLEEMRALSARLDECHSSDEAPLQMRADRQQKQQSAQSAPE